MTYSGRMPPAIFGYETTRLIGLGGMGEVHLARQVALNRPVAIKFLTRTSGDPSSEYEERFRREAELMARISHPNVVTIFDFGAVDNRPYLVMEYVEGGDLRSRMVPDHPMPIGQIRTIMKPVIRAVEYLHSQGIVHRDLKPENILMHREETPKVTDFGIAVLDFAIGSLTRTGFSLGTPGYVAPEQQYGLKVDARADQFSLAALGYELATGRKPLGAFPPPQKVNPQLGLEAGAVLLKALSEDPTDRFATIGEFGEALDRALAPVEVRPPPNRRRFLVPAIAGLLAVIGVTLLLAPKNGSAPTPAQTDPAPSVVREPNAPPRVVVAEPKRPPTTPRLTFRSVGMNLVEIPAGEFRMGSPPDEPGAKPEELPRHPVRISRPFFLGETEVTVAQFRKYIEATHSKTSAEIPTQDGGKLGGFVYDGKLNTLDRRPELTWRNPRGEGPTAGEAPVVQVSWYDAVAFCNWLSSQEGRPVRLPTEAEWEYACRAGSTTRWSSGDDPAALDAFAWTNRNSGQVLHPVGTLRPNAFGLFDMHGNAWEWCRDESGAYDNSAAVDPEGPVHKQARVLRGGSFDWDSVDRTRSASRHNYPPYMSYCNYGFRACSPSP